jgi:hypothetical protein
MKSLALWMKIRETCDVAFTLGSLFVVPVIVIAPINWMLENPAHVRSSVRASTLSDGRPQVSGELQFTTTPLRVRYNLELYEISSGRTFSYPTVDTKGDPQFDNVILPIHPNVKAGSYQLRARIQYAINPIKSAETVVQVASIKVE